MSDYFFPIGFAIFTGMRGNGYFYAEIATLTALVANEDNQ